MFALLYHNPPMPTNKSLSHAAYLLGLLLVVLPVVDVTMSVWPIRLSDDRWRFGAVGSLSNVLLVPLIGLLIIMIAAVWSDHRRVQRVVGTLCIAVAVVLAALDVLFILDYFQARTGVVPKFQQAITVAATTAFIKHLLSIAVLILLGRAGFAGPKPVTTRKAVPVTPRPEPLLTRTIPATPTE